MSLKILDSAGRPVEGVQEIDTATGHARGLLLDEQGNASVDPLNPDDLKRTDWDALAVYCAHGKL